MPVRERFTETVSVDVNGTWVQLPARELEIQESVRSRIIAFRFSVARTADVPDAAWNALQLNARLQISQQVGTTTDTFIGYVTGRPRTRPGEVPTVEVAGQDETLLATRRRFIDAWPSQTARTASEIFFDAWTRYGPGGLDLTGIQQNSSTIGPISSALDTLFDLSEEICRRTGWSWRIRNGRVEFWNPGATVATVTLREGDNIVAETLQIDEELPQVANVVYVPAKVRVSDFADRQPSRAGLAQYHLQYEPLVRQFEAGGQTVYLDQPPTVFLDGVERTTAEDGSAESASAEAVYNVENRWVRFNPGHEPAADGMEVRVVYTAELPVIVCRRSAESINLFGEIHERVVRSPRPSREEAEAIADAFLQERAFPIRPIQLDTTEFSLAPGMLVPVLIPSEGIEQLMPVVARTRRSRPGNLDISLTLNQLPVTDDDLVHDLWRRLSRLEAAETARQQRIEQYQEWGESWAWAGEVTCTLHACPFPGDTVFPSEELFPC